MALDISSAPQSISANGVGGDVLVEEGELAGNDVGEFALETLRAKALPALKGSSSSVVRRLRR